MEGGSNLEILLKTMKPRLNPGEYVFCTRKDLSGLNINDLLLIFREHEGVTVVMERKIADRLNLEYSFVGAWITLTVHSSLDAVGFTAAFSKALSENGISCNVIAAYYHDHIFIKKNDAEKAMLVLNQFKAS